MKLPKKKKIKGKLWRIREVNQPIDSDNGKCIGTCDYITRTIEIKRTLSKDSKLRTYLHEVLHAAWFESGLHLEEKRDEKLTQDLEDILLGLFKVIPK